MISISVVVLCMIVAGLAKVGPNSEESDFGDSDSDWFDDYD